MPASRYAIRLHEKINHDLLPPPGTSPLMRDYAGRIRFQLPGAVSSPPRG